MRDPDLAAGPFLVGLAPTQIADHALAAEPEIFNFEASGLRTAEGAGEGKHEEGFVASAGQIFR